MRLRPFPLLSQDLAKTTEDPASEASAAPGDDAGAGGASKPTASGAAPSLGSRNEASIKAAGRTAKAKGAASDEEAKGGASSKPVPKFRKRKAVGAAGLAPGDEATPFAGKAKTLGSSIANGQEGATQKSALAKLRAAKRAEQEAAAAEEQALAEAARAAELAARPLPVVLVEKLAQLLQAIVAALVSFARQLLLPSDVSFD